MNRLIFIFIVFVFTNYGYSQNNGTNSTTKSINNFDKELLKKQAALLDGEWLSDNYLKNIEKTKSIYLNKEPNTALFGFTLLKENLLSDTAFLFGFVVHEGGYGSPIIFDYKKNKFVYDSKRSNENTGIPSVPFELTVKNDSIIEMFFPETKTTNTYRKITNIQTALRKTLIIGNYHTIEKKERVTFDKNGSVKGFDNKIYYELAYDFVEGIEYDAIIFYKTQKGDNWSYGDIYKYEIKSDTLKLYHIKTDWENMEHKDEGLKYTLIKE